MIFTPKTRNSNFLKYSNIKLLLFFLYLINLTLVAKDYKPQYFVDAKGGLYLREEPLQKSKVIVLIPDKSEIKILKEVGDTVKLNEKSSRWTEIRFGNKSGFVFGAYIRKYFLLDKKFNPSKKLFYEYYTPEANYDSQCSYDESAGLEKECFIKIYRSINRHVIKILNYNEDIDPLQELGQGIWFGTKDWFDNKSLLLIDWASDGGEGFLEIGYLDIYSRKYVTIFEKKFGICTNENSFIEAIHFNGTTYYEITSENSKNQTGYFIMSKPKADNYDKLLETCRRDMKNSILVKPTTIVRKNYTFKINSKKAFFYFKGKDILNSD